MWSQQQDDNAFWWKGDNSTEMKEIERLSQADTRVQNAWYSEAIFYGVNSSLLLIAP